jgi:hypothetical protein
MSRDRESVCMWERNKKRVRKIDRQRGKDTEIIR